MLEDQARRLSIGRWMWFAGAGAAFITYLLTSGLLSVSYGDEDEDEEVWIEVGEDDDDEKEGLLVSGFEGDM
jgi:hypothetical protein